MDDGLRLTIQVLGSLVVIFGVLWVMWRRPGPEVPDSPAAAVLAFASVWTSLAAIGVCIWLWWTGKPDAWVVVSALLWSAGLALGGYALWTYRHKPADQMPEELLTQRLQARVGIVLGLIAVMLWYIFVLTHKAILTPIGT